MKSNSNDSNLDGNTSKAINQLKSILDTAFKNRKNYKQFNQRVLSKDQSLMDLVRYLPEISHKTISTDPTQLVSLGIWEENP